MKKDQRGHVLELGKKVIPHNDKGDPCFKLLRGGRYNLDEPGDDGSQGVLDQFTPEEVVFMVNRYLYATEYQRTVHRRRARNEAEALKPLKDKIKQLFGVSYTQATTAQIDAAAKALESEG